MILPTKHIPVRNSLLNIGGLLLKQLEQPRTVTALWERVRQMPEIGTFERFSLALDFLYTVGAVEFDDQFLHRCEK